MQALGAVRSESGARALSEHSLGATIAETAPTSGRPPVAFSAGVIGNGRPGRVLSVRVFGGYLTKLGQ